MAPMLIICGLVMYFSAIVGTPPFGDGSPFYRYGFSSIFAAAFAYRYRGGLAAAIGYDFFAVLGLLIPPPMAHLPYTLHHRNSWVQYSMHLLLLF